MVRLLLCLLALTGASVQGSRVFSPQLQKNKNSLNNNDFLSDNETMVSDAEAASVRAKSKELKVLYWGGVDMRNQRAVQARIRETHVRISYRNIWNVYKAEYHDLPGGICRGDVVWDVYSKKCWRAGRGSDGGEQCGNYREEGDCYNREHSWPKSWWGGTVNDAYSDLLHVFPSDGYVNGRRSNYIFGMVRTVTYKSREGHKFGSCSNTPGFCFEPTDRVKGLLARSAFWMNLRYDGLIDSEIRNIRAMRAWHESFPPDLVELELHNRLEKWQKNRNPFIDFPELVRQFYGTN